MSKLKDTVWDFLELLIIGVSIVLLTFWFVGQPVQVSGSSMNPTLEDGQQLVAEKLSYKLREPERGEVVILKHPNNGSVLLVKRVIGLPGEIFEITNDNVYINNSILNEPYLDNAKTNGKNALEENIKITIPDNKYIVLGDNREDSMDSRNWGFVDENDLVGRATFVYSPLSKIKLVQ